MLHLVSDHAVLYNIIMILVLDFKREKLIFIFLLMNKEEYTLFLYATEFNLVLNEKGCKLYIFQIKK